MKHLGDVTKINGAEIEPVDVITGGSPCQDLSVQGQRKGLTSERSGLFMEQIRVIKEMREHDRKTGRTGYLVRPRYMVWENVPGALSSNGGEDFRCVLEETARIVDPVATIPRPTGNWTPAGCTLGRGWSIAWRIHNSEFWGTAQSRRRLALVADFGGTSAADLLFDRRPVFEFNEPRKETREKDPGFTTNYSEQPGGNATTIKPIIVVENHLFDGRLKIRQTGTFQSICASMNRTRCTLPLVIVKGEHIRWITPKEVERLQGFPDNWTDIGEWTDSKGKKRQSSDSVRYKALGNSIALPFWFWLLRRIAAQYERPATLGSLFDGIGGFPLCWERCNGSGTARWASEIEEFPIAVTKRRFPDEAD